MTRRSRVNHSMPRLDRCNDYSGEMFVPSSRSLKHEKRLNGNRAFRLCVYYASFTDDTRTVDVNRTINVLHFTRRDSYRAFNRACTSRKLATLGVATAWMSGHLGKKTTVRCDRKKAQSSPKRNIHWTPRQGGNCRLLAHCSASVGVLLERFYMYFDLFFDEKKMHG